MQPSSTSPAGSKPASGPIPAIVEPTDAIVRVVLACVCGSDLWYYRGDSEFAPGPIGHEFIGVVEDIGADVRASAKGDFVIAPFAFSDGTCPNCQHGITTACINGGFYPSTATAARARRSASRSPTARSFPSPAPGHSDEMLRSLLTLSDVMATGHHAAVCAEVKPAARSPSSATAPSACPPCSPPSASAPSGSSRSAATPTASSSRASSAPPTSSPQRGEEAIETVKEMTGGVGVDATMECVGTGQSMTTALGIARAGSMVGFVGVPHGVELPIGQMFFRNVGVRGGGAPARVYIPELLDDVLEGRINPGRVLDYETDLDGIADAYAAMDERRAIKSLVRVGSI